MLECTNCGPSTFPILLPCSSSYTFFQLQGGCGAKRYADRNELFLQISLGPEKLQSEMEAIGPLCPSQRRHSKRFLSSSLRRGMRKSENSRYLEDIGRMRDTLALYSLAKARSLFYNVIPRKTHNLHGYCCAKRKFTTLKSLSLPCSLILSVQLFLPRRN